MELPFKPRQFVWYQFPYMEEPLRPGTKEHVGYVADVRQLDGNAHMTVMSLYTTTVPWEPDVLLPYGVIPFEPHLGGQKNHKELVLYARSIAFIPSSTA